ncbi:efflux RND transporter periplasmic adaptor subunit [uncultured Erythrobacter sp.]|uniref:efflux RND transporter periplasmic adaptor subunit n=1 Tax=uncultured Erythrobacter sp. TaxID=263913 RepID=UPI00261E776C|nr:efflux RND transporter periplasmic adaptor subunit [uncultured Erythrobacter sp.]
MNEAIEPSDDATEVSDDKRKYWLGGGVAVLLAIIAAAVYANSGETTWSDNTASIEGAVEEQVAAEDAVPEPETEPELDARGVIAAKDESTVASRMTARIIAMPFSEGRSFRRGALLARFDCSAIRAELEAARAATTAYQKTYETNVELDSYEAVGKNEVEVSRANLGRARAEANAVAAQLKDCAVYAPFSGTVVETLSNRGEVAASGQPLMRIQSGGDLEADLIVPSNWLTWLRPGAGFEFLIDETGTKISGEVTRLGASVDPVSKTIRVAASIDPGEALVLPGMSGTATFAEAKPPAELGQNEPSVEEDAGDGATGDKDNGSQST